MWAAGSGVSAVAAAATASAPPTRYFVSFRVASSYDSGLPAEAAGRLSVHAYSGGQREASGAATELLALLDVGEAWDSDK